MIEMSTRYHLTPPQKILNFYAREEDLKFRDLIVFFELQKKNLFTQRFFFYSS